MKRVSSALALVLGISASFSSAAQIQGFISGYAPSTVEMETDKNAGNTSYDYDSDFMWGLGVEYLANPIGPLMVGGGLGYFSVQKDGDDNLMMPAFPVWAYLGVIGPEKWTARPYLGARVGYPIPATSLTTWWDKPKHFFVTGNVGAQLPYHMGVEFDCTYLTMDKYVKKQDNNYRVSSLKFGGSITVHFDLFGGSRDTDNSSAEKENAAAEPALMESSYESNSNDTGDNSYPADPYSDTIDQPAEQAPMEPEAELADATPSEDQPAEEVAEAAPEESPEAEASAAEPAAEEPTEEPAAEPAPEPEPKPAAKKTTSKKKSAKKAPAKKKGKTAKKTTAKKTTKKKR